MNLTDENLLLEGLAKQNSAAIKTIYKDNYNIVQAYIFKNNGNEDDAKDVFQEAMMVLYEKSKNTDFKLTSKIGTFLYAISRHIWLKKLNKKGANIMKPIENYEGVLEHEDELEKKDEKEQILIKLEGAVEKLGEPCSSLIKAFYIEKQNMQLIAERFGYTNAENAKTQKYKCFMRLKKIFFDNKTER